MHDLISLSRMMNLYYHHLHNIANGPAFEGDHEMMLEFYEALDDVYDGLIEREMGLGGKMDKSDILAIVKDAQEALSSIPEGQDMEEHFQHALSLEAGFRMMVAGLMDGASQGTQNLLAQHADDSEVRTYKLGRRVK